MAKANDENASPDRQNNTNDQGKNKDETWSDMSKRHGADVDGLSTGDRAKYMAADNWKATVLGLILGGGSVYAYDHGLFGECREWFANKLNPAPQHMQPQHMQPQHMQPQHMQPQHMQPQFVYTQQVPVAAAPVAAAPVAAAPVAAAPVAAAPVAAAPVAAAPETSVPGASALVASHPTIPTVTAAAA